MVHILTEREHRFSRNVNACPDGFGHFEFLIFFFIKKAFATLFGN